MTRDEFDEMLDELACELPECFYDRLTGGIIVSDDCKLRDPSDPLTDGLLTLGEYRIDQMGRYIVIYYGSFMKLFPALTPALLRPRLREVLRHEFRHHLEGLGGVRDLELEDERLLADYRARKRRPRRSDV